jgi:hypothetical protein
VNNVKIKLKINQIIVYRSPTDLGVVKIGDKSSLNLLLNLCLLFA